MVRLATKEDMSDVKTFTGTTSPAAGGCISDKVTVSDLEKNSAYYYTYQMNGMESSPVKYATKSFSSFKILFLGSLQVGVSRG